jgi:hypothetical protein
MKAQRRNSDDETFFNNLESLFRFGRRQPEVHVMLEHIFLCQGICLFCCMYVCSTVEFLII